MSEVIDEALVEEPVASDDSTLEPEAVEAETVATPEPTFDPRELQAEVEHLRERDAYREQELAQIAAWARSQGATREEAQRFADTQTADLTPPDPFSDNYPAELAAYLEARDARNRTSIVEAFKEQFAEFTRPLQQAQEQQVIAEGEQQMRDVIADEFARGGELPIMGDDEFKVVDKIIDDVRNRYFPEAAQRYGQTNRAAEIAISRAVEAERAYQKRIAEAGVKHHENRLTTLSGQRDEPNGAGTGLQTGTDEILPPGALAQKYAVEASRLRNT